jgi:hypothetical protein
MLTVFILKKAYSVHIVAGFLYGLRTVGWTDAVG